VGINLTLIIVPFRGLYNFALVIIFSKENFISITRKAYLPSTFIN